MNNLNQNNGNENPQHRSNIEGQDHIDQSDVGRNGLDIENQDRPSQEEPENPEYNQEVEEIEDTEDPSLQDVRGQEKSFLDWVAELTDVKHKITGQEFAKEFMIWYQSGEDYEKEKHQEQVEKYQRWIDDAQPRQKGVLDSLLTKFKESKYYRYGSGKSSGGRHRIQSSLLDARTNELQGARLNPKELTASYKKACKWGYRFEAQSFLLALAWNGVVREEDVDHYYKSFGVPRTVNVYNEDGTQALDDDRKPISEKIYVSDKMDQWFTETKLRQDAVAKGKRPDTFSSGRRTLMEDPPGRGVKRMVLRSAEWQANSTDEDMLGNVSRRGDVPYATHVYDNINDDDQAEAVGALLKAKREEAPALIRKLKSQIEIIDSKMRTLPLSEDQQEFEQADRDKLEARVREENSRMKEIDYRLGMGIKVGDFKSFLLDPTNHRNEIKVGDKMYKESDLAVSLTVRKYWQSRSESEVKTLINGQHVKPVERETYLRLMGDKSRHEFMWSSKHHILGTRRSGKYDPYRDASRQIMEYESDNEKNARQFFLESRNMRFDGGVNMQTKKDLILYHPKTQQPKRLSKDNPLYPKNIDDFLRLSVEDLIKKNLWDSLDDEDDIRFKLGNDGLEYGHQEESTTNNEFISILAQGATAARQLLIEDKTFSNLGEILDDAQLKIDQEKRDLVNRFNFRNVRGLDETKIDLLKEIIKNLIQDLNPEQELDLERIIVSIPPDSGIDIDQVRDEIMYEVDDFNDREVDNLWSAQASLNELSSDYSESQTMANLENNESRSDVEIKIENINSELERIVTILDQFSPEGSFNLDSLSHEQRQDLLSIVDQPGHSISSAYQALVKKRLIDLLAKDMLDNSIGDND